MKKTLSMLVILAAILFSTVQPAIAAASFDLNIHNNTEDPVKINLTGPKNYSFTLDPGKWAKTVVEGTYKYSYTACGVKASGEIKVSDNDQWLIVDPCSAVPEYAKFHVDSHLEQAISLKLEGPQSYALAIELGTNRFLTLQTGFYTYSYEACGTTISGVVRITKNGKSSITAYACEQMGNHPTTVDTSTLVGVPSNLRIGSHYAFPIRVTLIGASTSSYSFELVTGLNRLNVVPGTYTYSYVAYGQYRSGSFTVTEKGVTVIFSPVK
jgi:hypothetical protein